MIEPAQFHQIKINEVQIEQYEWVPSLRVGWSRSREDEAAPSSWPGTDDLVTWLGKLLDRPLPFRRSVRQAMYSLTWKQVNNTNAMPILPCRKMYTVLYQGHQTMRKFNRKCYT